VYYLGTSGHEPLYHLHVALFHRDRFHRHSQGVAVALVVMALLAVPLGVAIVQGRSARAIEGVGADGRVTELVRPLRALQDGNPRPMLASVVKTLGVFHASGDPEWLYNIAGRPVFSFLGWGAPVGWGSALPQPLATAPLFLSTSVAGVGIVARFQKHTTGLPQSHDLRSARRISTPGPGVGRAVSLAQLVRGIFDCLRRALGGFRGYHCDP
jgi:hypothetical protein